MKASNYIIYLYVPESDDYYLVHGYSGAVDKVSPEAVRFLIDRSDPDHTWHTKDQEIVKQSIQGRQLREISDESVALLKQRGYLTEMSTQEERRYVERLAGFLHRKNLTSSPISFMIVPIYECNLRCPYCFEANTRVQLGKLAILKSVMTEGLVEAAFKSMEILTKNRFAGGEPLAANMTRHITLYGGEPLMEETLPIVEHIVQKGVEKGYSFSAVTNGVDLSHYTHLLGKDRIGSLQITLDGPRDIHDRKRIGPRHINGTYDKILENVKLVLDNTDALISIRFHVDWNNVNRSKELLEDLERRHLSNYKNFSIYSYPIHNFNRGVDRPTPPLMASHEIHRTLDNLLPSDDGAMRIKKPDDAVEVKLRSYVKDKLLGLHNIMEPCGVTTGMYIFDPLGRIYTCWETVGIAGQEVGTYSTHGPVLNSKAEAWLQRSPEKIEECKDCKYVLFHFGGCASLPLNSRGTIFGPACYEFQDSFIYTGQKFFRQDSENSSYKPGPTISSRQESQT